MAASNEFSIQKVLLFVGFVFGFELALGFSLYGSVNGLGAFFPTGVCFIFAVLLFLYNMAFLILMMALLFYKAAPNRSSLVKILVLAQTFLLVWSGFDVIMMNILLTNPLRHCKIDPTAGAMTTTFPFPEPFRLIERTLSTTVPPIMDYCNEDQVRTQAITALIGTPLYLLLGIIALIFATQLVESRPSRDISMTDLHCRPAPSAPPGPPPPLWSAAPPPDYNVAVTMDDPNAVEPPSYREAVDRSVSIDIEPSPPYH